MDGFLYRLDGVYHFMPEKRLVPYVALGLGGLTLDPDNGKTTNRLAANYGAGVKYFLTETIALRGDVRHVISFNNTYNNLIYTLGVDFIFGGKKKPVLPAAAPEKTVPPPAAPEPAPVVALQPVREADSDGDGVPDSRDKCPNTPRGVAVDSDGCPLDSDGDGVYDYLDKCPDTPRGVAVDKDGCPLDSDGDGVYDYLDKCPNTPRDLKVDATGCPILLKKTSTIDLDIHFDSNKADIKAQYHDRLKAVGDFMTTYPETKTVIEGHTDNTGSADYNQKLSQRRAESVRDYLIRHFNISPDRLAAKGYGKDRPIATNDTAEGRLRNRRIEAVITAETETYEKR